MDLMVRKTDAAHGARKQREYRHQKMVAKFRIFTESWFEAMSKYSIHGACVEMTFLLQFRGVAATRSQSSVQLSLYCSFCHWRRPAWWAMVLQMKHFTLSLSLGMCKVCIEPIANADQGVMHY